MQLKCQAARFLPTSETEMTEETKAFLENPLVEKPDIAKPAVARKPRKRGKAA
jgi:hypothetical protein